ncbi:MAG: hypothetical protein ACLQGN_19690, partial [Mycobacterium sp.]|uniref:hypothetical protein n=1 Tax=Mycobacterium sp. TaxID=1785 RepID=UPI003F963114
DSLAGCNSGSHRGRQGGDAAADGKRKLARACGPDQGTNHGWSNRSDEPCLAIGAMIDAIPRQ